MTLLSKDYDFFPYGTHYYCPPTPLPEDWEYDFGELSAAGYTHVQFRTLWRWHECRRGEFVWDDLDRIFDLAHKHGLRVVLKPMLENAPDYVFTELDGTRIGFHGVPITRFAMNSAYYVGGFMPCFFNPDVLEAAGVFLRLLIQRYREHPALWYYDAWNEPRSRPMAQCLCDHSVVSYRNWLREAYGTIDELNAALHKRWASYDTLIPTASNNDIVEMFLWRKWAGWAVSEQVRFVCDIIREEDPKAPVLVHAGCCDVLRDPACDSCDDPLNARHADRYGFSCNLLHWPTDPHHHDSAEFQAAWLRSVDPFYWCHELYPNSSDWCRSTKPSTLARHIWMAIAGGCSALTFWEYRSVRMGIRANGFGIREIDGGPTERSEVCDAIAGVVRDHSAMLASAQRVPAKIALLFSKDSDLLQRLTKMKTWMGDAEGMRPDVDYGYKHALRGAHLLYTGAGQDVDFVSGGGDLSGIGVLHVTCCELIDEKTAESLRAYVMAGGVLVAEFPFAARDERTWIHTLRPGYGLHELTGCRELSREVTVSDPPDIATFPQGRQIRAQGWRIRLAPEDADPIAYWNDGSVAATRRKLGKGSVYALGVNVSLSFSGEWQDPAFGVFEWLLHDVGVPHPQDGRARDVWIRRRRGESGEVWFIFNVADAERVVSLPAPPVSIWHACNATERKPKAFTLGPGAALVVEMALS
ncbi:MAG: hypothetical protein HON70_45980 [Lentisphaerae bacterium]|nr:hypothetical protein [Lentisphaerota bacterium]